MNTSVDIKNPLKNNTSVIVRCIVAALGVSVTLALPAYAQQRDPQSSGSPTFEIKRFDLAGNTLLSNDRILNIIAPYVGQRRTLADVQRAQAAVEEAYRDIGYGAVQVTLPEQDITSGVIRFRVLQPRVGKVILDGNKHFNSDNIRSSLPSIREGQIPNSSDIARNLQLTGEHPVKKTTVLLRTADDPERVDVNVKVDDERPWRVVVSVDNTGNSDTGYLRTGVGFQHSNLFNRDHVLSLQYITSPSNPSRVNIYGLGYHVPLYAMNSSADFYAGHSDVNSGLVQGLFNVAGKGTIFGAKWNYHLPKWGSIDQKLSLGLDYRAFRNNVTVAGVGLVPDITIHPVSLTYTGAVRDSSSEFNFNVGVSRNIPGGNDGDSAAFARTRLPAAANYTIYRSGANYQMTFAKDWQARAAVQGQYTRDALVPGEQFGLGGPDNLRGFLVRELSNDRGVSSQLEVYTPELISAMKLQTAFRLRLLAFYEYGQLWRNQPAANENASRSLSDIGLGMRLNYGKAMSLRFDVARITHAPNLLPAGNYTGTRQFGENRISAGLALVF